MCYTVMARYFKKYMDDLKQMNKKAQANIMAVLREKFKKQIEAQSNKLIREQKFVDSLGVNEDPVHRIIEDHRDRVKSNDLIKIQIDKKTCIYVAREKCIQDKDGRWSKKQN